MQKEIEELSKGNMLNIAYSIPIPKYKTLFKKMKQEI
jgi:hypothetical protein